MRCRINDSVSNKKLVLLLFLAPAFVYRLRVPLVLPSSLNVRYGESCWLTTFSVVPFYYTQQVRRASAVVGGPGLEIQDCGGLHQSNEFEGAFSCRSHRASRDSRLQRHVSAKTTT